MRVGDDDNNNAMDTYNIKYTSCLAIQYRWHCVNERCGLVKYRTLASRQISQLIIIIIIYIITIINYAISCIY